MLSVTEGVIHHIVEDFLQEQVGKNLHPLQSGKESHPDENPIPHLPKVGCPRVIVYVCTDFVNPWKRMKDRVFAQFMAIGGLEKLAWLMLYAEAKKVMGDKALAKQVANSSM
jgi:hypothetical protein